MMMEMKSEGGFQPHYSHEPVKEQVSLHRLEENDTHLGVQTCRFDNKVWITVCIDGAHAVRQGFAENSYLHTVWRRNKT